MTGLNTMAARGFEHLHVNDMGSGCVVLWQRTVCGGKEALVVDIAQLEQAIEYLRSANRPAPFRPRPAND